MNRNLGRYLKNRLAILVASILLASGFMSSGMVAHATEQNSGNKDTNIDNWISHLQKQTRPDISPEKHDTPPEAAMNREETGISPAAKVRKKKGPEKISVDFYKVDLHNVFRLLGQVSGKNIVVDEGVKGTLTLAMKDVPWTFVLEVIKNLKGLESTERYGTIMIYPGNKKISWAKEQGSGGMLEMAEVDEATSMTVSPLVPSSSLAVSRVKRSKTPVKNILKAEKLIKDAARYEKAGQIEDAYFRLAKASELWPDNIAVLKKLASLSFKSGQTLQAYNYARAAEKLDPKDPEAAMLTAISLASLNRPKEAKNFFEKALNTGKMDKDGLWNYAVFLFSQGDYRGALRLVNRIEAKFPVEPEMIMMKAQCYEHLNKIRQAAAEYNTLLSAGNQVPPNLTEYARLRLANIKRSNENSIAQEGR